MKEAFLFLGCYTDGFKHASLMYGIRMLDVQFGVFNVTQKKIGVFAFTCSCISWSEQ